MEKYFASIGLRSHFMRTLTFILFLMALLLPVTMQAGQSGAAAGVASPGQSAKAVPRTILFLNTYQIGLPIPDGIEKGFVAELNKSGGSVKNVFIEHLDLARELDSRYREIAAELLRRKMAGKHIGIILAEGMPAVSFLTVQVKDLFPNVPLLTLIAPNINFLQSKSHEIINIPWQVDNAGTLRAALSLFPGIQKVLVVTGAHDTVLPFLQYAKEAFAPWKDKLEFEYTNKMTYEQMLQHVSELPKNSIVIYSPYFTDTSDRSFVPAEVVVEICRLSPVPVFANLEYFLGRGIVGGSLLKTESMGRQAAKITLEYLNGRLKLDKPITTFTTSSQMMFDWRELLRWKANLAAMPKDSIVINRPPSLWLQYKNVLTSITLIFLILTGLVCALYVMNRRLRRLTEAVGRSEAHYHSIFANSLVGVTVTDRNFVFTDVNDAFCRMLEYSRKELIGKKTISDVSHHDDVDKSMEMIAKLSRHDIDHYTIEKRYISKTGKVLPTLVYVRGHYNRSGEYEGTTASNLDITERKKAEELLKENEEKYRMLFNNAEIAMFRSRFDGSETLEVNQKFLDIVGKTREETVGKPSAALWADSQEREEMVRRLIADGSVSDFEFKMLNAQKGVRNCLTSLRLYKDQGILEGSVADITERKLAEAEKEKLQTQLIQAQKMEAIGTLAGGIAHDFNNILGAILGYAEMARDDCPPGSSTASDLDEVILASNRAKDLVKQILAFSRQAGSEKIPLQPVLIVKEAVKLLRSSLPTTITIRQDVDSETGMVLADPTQIHQIVMNLCTNAYHAMEETGGTLFVSLKNRTLSTRDLAGHPYLEPGDFVELTIADDGPGIPDAIREKIFDPYFTTKETGKGTGMGLAIVHGIVKSCGGFITCRSDVGKGTVFTIALPTFTGQATGETQAEETFSAGTERILLVDDEKVLADMAQTMLERMGYAVTARTSSVEALTTFSNAPGGFDLVITDQTMPGMTGFDLARRMLQIRPDLPIILCTGYSNQVSEEKANAHGIRGFAMKPLAKKQIASLIREILDEGEPN